MIDPHPTQLNGRVAHARAQIPTALADAKPAGQHALPSDHAQWCRTMLARRKVLHTALGRVLAVVLVLAHGLALGPALGLGAHGLGREAV